MPAHPRTRVATPVEDHPSSTAAGSARQPGTARPSMWQRLEPRLPALLAVVLPTAALAVNAAHYLPFLADDALISLRYVDRFLDGHGLTWTAGPPVEGYSNLLWVLLLAVLGALGLDLIVASRVLGFACGALVFWGLARMAAPITWRRLPGALVPGGLYAASGTAAVWTVGGLEQPLVPAALVWMAVKARPLFEATPLSDRATFLTGLPAVALCLTRPDSPLFVALLAGALVVAHRGRPLGWRRAILASTAPVLAVAAHLAARRGYYHDWVPNTAHIKANWSWPVLSEGLDYLAAAAPPYAPALGLAAVGLAAGFRRQSTRAMSALILTWVGVWCAYVASVGGDIFPAHRQLAAALTGLALAASLGWPELLTTGRRGLVLAVPALAAVAGLWALQRHDPESKRAEFERWEWDGEVIGNMLARGFGAQAPLLAVNAAGTLPYFSKLPAIDMLGLNDRHIARQPPVAGGTLAHDHTDGDYILGLEPDLIFFRTAVGGLPAFVSGDQIKRDRRFRLHYQKVNLEGFDPHLVRSAPYIRIGGPLGLQLSPDAIRIPAWHFSHAIAQPEPEGGIVARLVAGKSGHSPPIPLPAGRWRLALEPEHPRVQVEVQGDRAMRISEPGVDAVIETFTAHAIRVRLRVDHADTPIRAVHLQRLPAEPARPRGLTAPMARRTWQTLRPASDAHARVHHRPLSTFHRGLAGWRTWGKGLGTSKGREGLDGPMLHTRSSVKGDASLGRALGPAFDVPTDAWISLKVGGGNAAGLYVRLTGPQGTIAAWNGPAADRMLPMSFDLRQHAGQRLWLEVHDRAKGPWGHVRLADVVLHHSEQAR